NAQLRGAEQTLAVLDGLPPLLERRQAPPRAALAHHPQPPFRRVECQPPPDREMLDGFVQSEGRVAEKAGGIHVRGGGRANTKGRGERMVHRPWSVVRCCGWPARRARRARSPTKTLIRSCSSRPSNRCS